jgi:thioredoxin
MAIVICPNCGSKNRVDERANEAQAVCGKCGTKLLAPAATEAGHPVVVTDDNFAEITANSKPVLVDFWATWCPPCRAIAPVLEQIARESDGRYVIGKLDVDQNQRTAGQFQIDGIPTMLIFKNGKVVDRLVGAHPKQTIVQHLAAQT